MRKIIVSEFLTLDGVMEAPDKWQLKFVNEEMSDDIEGEIVAADGLLYGRTTYLAMAAAWPSRTGTIADQFNKLPKHVVSTTLEKAEWNNSTLINGNIIEEIIKLKEQQGKPLLVWGSWKLVQALIQNKLIDEYRLYIHPILQGTGKRLFEEGIPAGEMKLAGSKALSTGVVILNYKTIH